MSRIDQRQDEILYCAHCGISFLYSQEEQKLEGAAKAPLLCHGCRLLAPGPARARGVVKWYQARKQYGFIIRKDAPELYVHASALLEARSLHPGDLVEFTVRNTDRGPAADEVVIL